MFLIGKFMDFLLYNSNIHVIYIIIWQIIMFLQKLGNVLGPIAQ